MAKRKRLTVPNSSTAGPTDDTPMSLANAPIGQSPMRRAPIADVAGQAALNDALERVTEEMTNARNEGRMVLKLPLDAVAGDHLIRDRMTLDPAEMEALEASLQARGQQTPIEVLEIAPGRYGLISGWRRLTALRALNRRGEGPGTVLALLRKPGDASEAYTAMVEENELRVGLSHFERASIVVRAVEAGVFPHDRDALQALFGAVSRPKRSKIKTFLPLVRAIGSELRFPAAISERLGLALAARIAEDRRFGTTLRSALKRQNAGSAEEELACLQVALAPKAAPSPAPQAPQAEPERQAPAAGLTITRSGHTLRISGPALDDALVAEIEALVARWQ